MSIIHDALKKIQRGRLTAKANQTPVNEPAPEPQAQETEETQLSKPSAPKKINSVLALVCAVVITVVALSSIFQQFRKDMPLAQRWAKASFLKLIHKDVPPEFKTRKPEDLKPLAKITIAPPAAVNSPAAANTAKSPAGLTLDIHGVMANASGNLVLINDQVYQEGDEVDGAKIVKINLDSVTILNNGKEETIRVGQ